MPSAFAISVIYSILTVVIAGAWVAGYLDKYQKMAQNVLLGAMGENRMSYGLKSTIKSQQVDDKSFQNLQGSVADGAGDLVSKGGVGEGISNTISKAFDSSHAAHRFSTTKGLERSRCGGDVLLLETIKRWRM